MKRRILTVAAVVVAAITFRVVTYIGLVEIDPRLKLHISGGGNSTVLQHRGDEALMVDPKYRFYAYMVRHRVEHELAAKVRRMVLTHAHNNHAGGRDLYDEASAVMVHPNTAKRLAAAGDPRAFVVVDRELKLWLDGEEVVVLDIGSGHTDGDLVVLFPSRKLLVAGDLVNEGIVPDIDPKYGGDMLVFARTFERLMQLDFERVVPGHGDVMSRAQVQVVADYVIALEARVRDARARGRTEDETAAELKFDEFPLDGVLFVTSRDENIRFMYRSVAR